MSLLFNMLTRLVRAFLPGSKHLLISWLQSPSTVILETPKMKTVTVSIVSPSICHEVMGTDAMVLVFWMLSFKPAFSLPSFTFIKRLFSSSSLSAIRVVLSAYLGLLISLLTFWFQLVLHPAQHFSWYTLHISEMQGDNIQPWRAPFPIQNQFVVPCQVITVASWPAYMFLKRQVRWSGVPISLIIFLFVVIHTIKSFDVVNKEEVDVFLKLSWFFSYPTDVSNLISGSSAFSKPSLNIWKFSVHVLLKPGLQNFEHCLDSMWDECSRVVVWTFFGNDFLWDWNKTWPFPVLWPLLNFPNLLAYWGQHFHSIIF